MRTPTNTLLVAMAVSDTMTGLSPIPVYLYFYTSGGYKDYVPYHYNLRTVPLVLRDYVPYHYNLRTVPLVLVVLLSRRTSAHNLPHCVRLAHSRTRRTEVMWIKIIHVVTISLGGDLGRGGKEQICGGGTCLCYCVYDRCRRWCCEEMQQADHFYNLII